MFGAALEGDVLFVFGRASRVTFYLSTFGGFSKVTFYFCLGGLRG
jgi:hypothetical protein